MAESALAFGIIGALVVMLDSVSSNPSALGTGLAVPPNTTLYGALLARSLLVPAANKLLQRQKILRFRNDLIVEGMSLLAEKRSPRLLATSSTLINSDQKMKTADGQTYARRAARL